MRLGWGRHIQIYRECIPQSGRSMGHPLIIFMQLLSLRPSGRKGQGQSSRYVGPGLKTMTFRGCPYF